MRFKLLKTNKNCCAFGRQSFCGNYIYATGIIKAQFVSTKLNIEVTNPVIQIYDHF